MSDFENRLMEGLDSDDEAFLKNLEEGEGLFQQMGSTFRGPLGGWTIYAFILSFVMFGVGVWAMIEMLGAESLRETVLWFALLSAMLLAVSMIKIWFWLRMNHLATLRQLKLLELRLMKQR